MPKQKESKNQIKQKQRKCRGPMVPVAGRTTFSDPCWSHCTTLWKRVETWRQGWEGTGGSRGCWGGGAGGGGERIATVITNKNHLSHLCNLFSFNMRSMLKRSGSLSEVWEGPALGHSQASPGLQQQGGIMFKPTCTLTLYWPPHGQRRQNNRQNVDPEVLSEPLGTTSKQRDQLRERRSRRRHPVDGRTLTEPRHTSTRWQDVARPAVER